MVKDNTFIIESDFDNEVAGEYEIKVIAKDKNGNESNDSFKVIVNRNYNKPINSETKKEEKKQEEVIEDEEIIEEEIKEETQVEEKVDDKPIENKEEENKQEEEIPEEVVVPSNPSPIMTCDGCEVWEGRKLTRAAGVINGPSGKETYYNLNMEYVVLYMRRQGYSEEDYPYWIREDGVKMLGPYVMIAADYNIRPKGSLVQTSLGCGIVVDTGSFVAEDQTQIDIAVNW